MKTKTNRSGIRELTPAELAGVGGGVKATYDEEGNLVATCTHTVSDRLGGALIPRGLPPYQTSKLSV